MMEHWGSYFYWGEAAKIKKPETAGLGPIAAQSSLVII